MNPAPASAREPASPRSLGRLAPAVVLLAGLALGVLAFFYIRREEAEGRAREFERRASNTALRVEDYLQRREETLYALRDLFEYSDEISRTEFAGFAHDLLTRQIGIRALEWAPLVPDADRSRVEAGARAQGFPQFEFTEHVHEHDGVRRTGDRPLHAPVLFIEPLAGNETAIGFDLSSEKSVWTRLLNYAADGSLAASGRLPLLVPSSSAPAWGYIVELPVYRRPSSTLGSPAERTAQLRGFVLGIFELADVIEEMFHRMGGIGVDVLILDRSAPEDRQFLHYHPAVPMAAGAPTPTPQDFLRGQHTMIAVNRAGRQWELWFRPARSWLAAQPTYRSWFFGSAFLGLAIGLSLYLHNQQRRAAMVERLVAARTIELIESRRELTGFLRALPGMAFRGRYDEKFTLFYVSEGCVALTGYASEDFLAGRVHLRDLIAPDDLARVRAATRASIADGRPLELEYRLRTRDGQEKWVLSRGRGRRAEDEKLNFFEGLAIDITAQKNAERERLALERKLLEGQKLESLGLLAGGVAHDFNNLLTGVLGNANLARLSLPADSSVQPHLAAIETASLRAAELCRQMLAYAGKGRFVVEPVDLNTLAEGLVPLLNISIGHRAELHLELVPGLAPVMADATQLRQIVMNLVLNAADATSARPGTIRLASGMIRADAALLARCAAGADCVPGDYVYLEVHDNGVGMTPEVRAKIFDPFFTTKFAGRGLGLAAALGIVRSHQGALQVESTPGEGSTFRLMLPPSPVRDSQSNPPFPPAPASWRLAGRALVIDDEEPVRTVTAKMLERFGLTARTAATGEAGVAIFRADPAAIDVVLLDLVMPVMNGEQTLEALRAIRADVRVLLVSGYTEGELLRRFGPVRGQLAFLSKPFTREALAEKLRELLESA